MQTEAAAADVSAMAERRHTLLAELGVSLYVRRATSQVFAAVHAHDITTK